MKTLITLSVAVIFFFTAFAKAQSTQTCDCKKDLSFINDQIQEMTSFKKQAKGEVLTNYKNTYEKITKEVTTETSVTECYRKLNELLSTVEDKHAYIKHIKPSITAADLESDEAMDTFLNSDAYKNQPVTTEPLEALRATLSNKPFESIEGIYDRAGKLTIGVKKSGDSYQGIVLDSKTKSWAPGQIMYIITPNGESMYDVQMTDVPGGKMYYVRALLFSNGSLWHLNKLNRATAGDIAKDQMDWEFKTISDDTQYLYMGTFSNRKENVAAFNAFYEEHKDKFTAKNIIVDLRNNSGGNTKYAYPFHKILKKSKANVYIITNFWTGSAGEHLTVKLKTLKNTVHLGERTYGAMAYGSNYGRLIDAPSGHFAIFPTDMNFHKFIDYEYVGVTPEIQLDFNKDWIAQTRAYIAAQQP